MSDSMQIDMDGDGTLETTVVDLDGDGVADAYDMVDPVTGAEMIVVDSDVDGTMDTVVVDIDGDGVLDAGASDTDGDGVFDSTFDPNDGSELTDPLAPADEDADVDPFDATQRDSPGGDADAEGGVHGDPMAEIPYHQAQIGPNDCLPTSVAMIVTEITGDALPQDDVVDVANELGLLGPDGMSVDGGVQLLEHYGVEAEVQTGSVDDLRAMLDAGKPVIIGLDSDDLYGAGDSPFADDLVTGHAVVITGIDDEAGLVYINDPGLPDGAGVAIPLTEFEDAWADADNTMIVADHPDGAGVEADTDTDTDTDITGSPGDPGSVSGEGDGGLHDLALLPFTLLVGK